MGLSVITYTNIKKEESQEQWDFIASVPDPMWDHKIKHLDAGAGYSGDGHEWVSYSYSSHNRFREHLLKFLRKQHLLTPRGKVDWSRLDTEPETPFYDLINFSDCEGCLDWETNEKLYNDFKAYESQAEIYAQNNHIFVHTYRAWLGAFDKGRQKNAVAVFR